MHWGCTMIGKTKPNEYAQEQEVLTKERARTKKSWLIANIGNSKSDCNRMITKLKGSCSYKGTLTSWNWTITCETKNRDIVSAGATVPSDPTPHHKLSKLTENIAKQLEKGNYPIKYRMDKRKESMGCCFPCSSTKQSPPYIASAMWLLPEK